MGENAVLVSVGKTPGTKEPTQVKPLLLEDLLYSSTAPHSATAESLLPDRWGPQHQGNQREKAFVNSAAYVLIF